jgi:hypothetical protein
MYPIPSKTGGAVMICWRLALLSRRLATTLGILATLGEVNWGRAAQTDAPAGGAAEPASPPPLRTTVEPVDKDQVVAILGRAVSGPEGKLVGHLTDVLVDGTGQPQAAVLDIGGFMGVGTRSIAVHWKALHFAPSDPKAPITLDLSLDEIKATPEYKGLGDKPAPVVAPVAANPAPAH